MIDVVQIVAKLEYRNQLEDHKEVHKFSKLN